MNKITKLLDENYVKDFFTKKVLPLYPSFKEVRRVRIRAHKKFIWEHTYHVVLEFKTVFKTYEGQLKTLPIFCSAHSSEPRRNVFDSLNFLWESSFSKGYLSIPRPLFYSEHFRGTFYRGVAGENLYRYIKEKDYGEIESILPKTARWFAKLHNLSTKNAPNFNKENSRIKTVFPGKKHIMDRVISAYPEYEKIYKDFYSRLIEAENHFFSKSEKRWIVHGDAHPENIIRMSRKKIAVIDFTDICISDHARDLGSFSQQLDYMCGRKINNPRYSEKLKKIFFDSYFKDYKGKHDQSLEQRIKNYYDWTAIRTATHFLLKHNPEPERAEPLIKQILAQDN